MDKQTHPDPKAWFKRAQDSWSAANALLGSEQPMAYSAVSRLFYAVMQGSKARLLWNRKQPREIPASHLGFIAYLGRVDRELGASLNELWSYRLKADYCDDEVTEAQARELLQDNQSVASKLQLSA